MVRLPRFVLISGQVRHPPLSADSSSQALQLSLLTSHTSTIKACSARSITTLEGDRRIWAGLDWVVAEVSQRVYYGTGGGALGSTSRPNKSMDQETIASSATASQ